MESKGLARVYQDFEPSMEWVPEDDSDTLLLYLPGFAKEQLRVQLRSRNLIISGERKLQQNTWSRFRVEFPVSANCDVNKISAKFEGNILFVRQPKLITQTLTPKPQDQTPPTTVAEPKPTPIPNVGLKTATTPSHMQNNETGQDPKTRLPEENSEKIKEKGGESDTISSNLDKRKKKVVYDKTAKTALENYKKAVGVFADKLKTSRNAVNTIVILLIGLAIGVYLAGSIKSWTKA